LRAPLFDLPVQLTGWEAVLFYALLPSIVGGIQESASQWTIGRYSGAAGMSGSHKSECSGNPSKAELESVMNSDESAPENVLRLKRCEVCGRMHVRSGATCSRECRMMLAEFTEFYMLEGMLSISRWTGGKSQEQLHREYYDQQMWDAVRRLPQSADALAEALIEILAELAEAEPECPAERV
jgi:hypothetical protein